MESNELISIIIPVYNVASYLPTCIDSVLRQTYTAWELLLIDDGSTDGSDVICSTWAARDDRIRAINSQHAGPAKARNTGIGLAKGDYIFFMDSDDWMEPDALAYMLDTIRDRDVDIVVCGAYFDYPTRTKTRLHVKTDCILSRNEALGRVITGRLPSYLWMMFFRRSVVQEPLVDIPCYEDYATVYKWFAHADRVAIVAKAKYHYVQREGSILHTQRRDKFLLDIYRERHNYISQHHLMDATSNQANTVRNLLKLAKDFARKPLDVDERLDFVTQVRSQLMVYLPVSFSRLGLKRWLRLWLLMRSVPLFIRLI